MRSRLPLLAGLLFAFAASPLAAAEVKERVMGDPDAPVEIIEYASLTCPHCAAFHEEKLPTLKEEYIDTGKARLVMRDFPLDQWAAMASVLAHCAGDERYFQFIDALFKTQGQWARSSDVPAALTQLGQLGGLSADEAKACFADQSMLDAVLEMRLEGQREYDIRSTPSFVIDGEVLSGNLDLEAFAERIEAGQP